jgi:ABC-2 type transport system permease protein
MGSPRGSYFRFIFSRSVFDRRIGSRAIVEHAGRHPDAGDFVFFFYSHVFVLMGGLYTPIESMPDWAQTLSSFNPVRYFIRVMRAIVIKGSGIGDLIPELKAMIVFGIVLNTLAVLNYRKRST